MATYVGVTMKDRETFEEDYEQRQQDTAYVFDPSQGAEESMLPNKRRKASRRLKVSASQENHVAPAYPRLFDGAESEQCAGIRKALFEDSWSKVDDRIQGILREANQSTLHGVTSFLQDAHTQVPINKIPSAFIITGPNISSQELLFEQLSETLQTQADAKVVRLRSGDASNLKAILKKIIHEVAAKDTEEGDEPDFASPKDGRKFLSYDLEALHAHLNSHPYRYIAIAFQDSEAFDSVLLSDLISLLTSWRKRIPFALLFGVATSVELFEARLLKSTCHLLYGDHFDTEQAQSIVDKIFRIAVAYVDAPIRLGPSLMQSLLARQRDQIASIPIFVNSLKYAYMCHFYSNPLTALLVEEGALESIQQEHVEALRCLPSFRHHIDMIISSGDLSQARLLILDDTHLKKYLKDSLENYRQWVMGILPKVEILSIGNSLNGTFTDLYLKTFQHGIDLMEQHAESVESIKRNQPQDVISILREMLSVIDGGNQSPGTHSHSIVAGKHITSLSNILTEMTRLQEDSEGHGHVLRSKYAGKSKMLRTTVVAQKVQLLQDTATLTDEDKSYTKLIDCFVETLQAMLLSHGALDITFHEIWLYDARAPYKDVFIPRPRAVVERALSQPHDYLGCSCCKTLEDQIMSTLPPTATLYQMYLETGSLINVGDLWSAYLAVVGEDDAEGLDERSALVLFYRAIAELRGLGFVKQSRKKADHIAKLAWKGL